MTLSAWQSSVLTEMGIPTFVRRSAPEAASVTPVAVAVAPAPAAPLAPRRPELTPVPAPVPAAPATRISDEEISRTDWPQLRAAVAACRGCSLCQTRTQTVFGTGREEQVDWLVVGEAPGHDEDLQGLPFVGRAGQLLDNMLAAAALQRGREVYIANVLKCRPPDNRNPQPNEVACCLPFLRRQMQLLQPKIILALGRFAAQSLLDTEEAIGRLRGRTHQYEGVPLIVSYHPAYLLRSPTEKAKAWEDLCRALAIFSGEALA